MLHRRLFTTRALKELFEAHGFVQVEMRGAGYHPFPPALGRVDVDARAFHHGGGAQTAAVTFSTVTSSSREHRRTG